jgi:ribosomal protein S27AE
VGASYESRTFKNVSVDDLHRLIRDEIDQAASESGISYSGDWGEKGPDGVEIIRNFVAGSSDQAEEYIQEKHPDNDDPLIAIKVARIPESRSLKSLQKRLTDILEKLEVQRVRVGVGFGCVNGKPVNGLDFKDLDAYRKEQDVKRQIFERVKAEKSKFKSCGRCESKINKTHLNRHHCPICGYEEFLQTETDKKRIESIHQRISKLEYERTEAERKIDAHLLESAEAQIKKGNWYWYVGGWCRS